MKNKKNSLTCTEFERLEMKLLDNELTDEERVLMSEHTGVCESCASDLELYKSINEDMQLLPIPQIENNFTEKVMYSVYALPQPNQNKGLAFLAMCTAIGAVSSVVGFISLIMQNSVTLTAMLYRTPQLTRAITALSQANGRADVVVTDMANLVGANTDSITFAVITLVMIIFGIYSALEPTNNKI